jgi:hypothetical protein
MKEARGAIRDAGLNLQVSGQTLAELQEIYDEVVVQKALELLCECEFPTLPPASLENGSVGNGASTIVWLQRGGRFIQNLTISFSEIVKNICLFVSVIRFTDTFCTNDKTALHRKVSDMLPDLVNKYVEGSRVGGAERLKKRVLRYAPD